MKTNLRYNEYYDIQDTFDLLYEKSLSNATNNTNLYDKIISRENILLAYRTIKGNKGSKTKGTDFENIDDIKLKTEEEFINFIRNALTNYKPNAIRRVEIPKPNGQLRPLGIPTIRDRIIQQMFKQILEPICEAKFYNHSYGFRPNRSAKHAIARCQSLMNFGRLHYVVDIDIKGFFDNVNHRKLIKQLFNIGIKDKRVLTIINKMLKTPIEGIGTQDKGTPQGGILSPLLSNVVLNDLDKWIYSQWEGFKTNKVYHNESNRLRALKTNKCKLKEMFIVRYADDFKIFTTDYKSAIKIFHAVRKYLKDNLHLDISMDKSKITNVRKNNTKFLGFKLKLKKKNKKYVVHSHITNEVKERLLRKAKTMIKKIQKEPSAKNVNNYNAFIISAKNYFKYATHISVDFNEIQYRLYRTIYNRLKSIGKYEYPINPSPTFKDYNYTKTKTFKIKGTYLHIISDIKTVNNFNFSQDICDYTKIGREKIKKLNTDIQTEIIKIMQKFNSYDTVEYQDNRLSKYSMQKGHCAILNTFITSDEMHCHHIKPKFLGGNDNFSNLVIIHEDIHKLIHATNLEMIKFYINKFKLNTKQIGKVNRYRKECNLELI